MAVRPMGPVRWRPYLFSAAVGLAVVGATGSKETGPPWLWYGCAIVAAAAGVVLSAGTRHVEDQQARGAATDSAARTPPDEPDGRPPAAEASLDDPGVRTSPHKDVQSAPVTRAGPGRTSELGQASELSPPPEYREIVLRDGSTLTVLAHGYSVEGDTANFSLVFKGSPDVDVTTLRLPLRLLPEDFS